MKILFLCTVHNSLSQRLYLALSPSHNVTIEYALSDELMISAAAMVKPDLIICPFLTARVPREVFNTYLTLIIHPGPPGDAGPSALDWLLLGDDGCINETPRLLEYLDKTCLPGRTYWGVSIIQAIEEFDSGPVWAFEQFPIIIDDPTVTKSELYRGPVSRCAISACVAAIRRVSEAARAQPIRPNLEAHPNFRTRSVQSNDLFQGGKTHTRPLLKAAQREFDVKRHVAQQISRRIRCGDSQPGSLSKIFGTSLYVYGGLIDSTPGGPNPGAYPASLPGDIVAFRGQAVCFLTRDGQGIWISHIRRPKRTIDAALWPKVPAVSGLLELGVLKQSQLRTLEWELPNDFAKSPYSTFQEVWVEFVTCGTRRAAYLYFEFYNGAMSVDQCSQLIEAMEFILKESSMGVPVNTVVLMGGSYFSNGIALNVIEGAADPAQESWMNINRINDVVLYVLDTFRKHNMLSIAGIRGNAAAGGVALAAACDIVICGAEVVLNPSYRALGLHGSEYHTLSYNGRCGKKTATEILNSMLPISPFEARAIGLIDHVFPGHGTILEKRIRNHVAVVVRSGTPGRVTLWKSRVDSSPANISLIRTQELAEMSKDFWSARSIRYNCRRFAFVRKVKARHTPYRFAIHRRIDYTYLDEEERSTFENVTHYESIREENCMTELHKRLNQPRNQSDLQPLAFPAFGTPRRSPVPIHVAYSPVPVADQMFSCYYSSPELVHTPSGGCSGQSSVNGLVLGETATI